MNNFVQSKPWQCSVACTALYPASGCACFEQGGNAEDRINVLRNRKVAEKARADSEAEKQRFEAGSFASPPEDWKDKAEYIFLSFVLEQNEDWCATCGSVHRWSNVYRAFGKRGHDVANYRRLVPATGSMPEKVGVVRFQKPPRKLPICHHCLTGDKDGAAFLVSSETAWNEAVRRDREGRAKARDAAAGKPVNPHTGKPLESLL